MSLYEQNRYHLIIKSFVEARQATDASFNFQKLAELAGIQKTYLSKVMNKKAELSRDQCFAIAEVFDLSDDESDYLMLVHDFNRTENKTRAAKLEKKMIEWQDKHLHGKNALKRTRHLSSPSSARYYLQPEHQLVHVALGLPAYAKDTSLLSDAFGFSPIQLSEILRALEEMGIIQLKGKTAEVIVTDLHLSKDVPWYKPWLELIRLRSLSRLNVAPVDQTFGFAATFTCSKSAFQQIKVDAMKYIQQAKLTTENTKKEGMFQLNFDLFPWL